LFILNAFLDANRYPPASSAGQLSLKTLYIRRGKKGRSGNRPDPGPHQPDAVEIGMLPRVFFGALARLIALVEQLDFLELLESLGEQLLASSS